MDYAAAFCRRESEFCSCCCFVNIWRMRFCFLVCFFVCCYMLLYIYIRDCFELFVCLSFTPFLVNFPLLSFPNSNFLRHGFYRAWSVMENLTLSTNNKEPVLQKCVTEVLAATSADPLWSQWQSVMMEVGFVCLFQGGKNPAEENTPLDTKDKRAGNGMYKEREMRGREGGLFFERVKRGKACIHPICSKKLFSSTYPSLLARISGCSCARLLTPKRDVTL